MSHLRRVALNLRSLFPILFRVRTAQRQAFHRLSSAEFRRGLPLLQVASGILAKARRPLRRVSWLRPAQVGDFPAGARLPRGELAISQSPVSWTALLF